MDYEVILSMRAKAQITDIIEYYSTKLLNVLAINKVLKDFEKTKEYLMYNPMAFPICNDPKLQEAGFRMIKFSKHKYFLLYTIKGNNVIIEAVFSESQNYSQLIN